MTAIQRAGASVAAAFIESRDAARAVSIYDVDVCAFCNAIGVQHRCAWRVEREVTLPIAELRVGDQVKLGPHYYREVLYFVRSHGGSTIFYQLAGETKPRSVIITDPAFAPSVRGIRPAPCGAVCCERCSCERAENIHYCADHWRLPA